jgi:hypothetical protein
LNALKDPAFRSKFRFPAGVALFSAAYFLFWSRLDYPYRLFPTDDEWYRMLLQTGIIQKQVWESHHPTFLATLELFFVLLKKIGADPYSSLLLTTTFPNALTLVLIALLIRKISGSAVAAFAGMAVFAASAWPYTYHIMFSYTPLSAMLSTASVYFMVLAYFRFGAGKRWVGFLHLLLSLLASSLFFWSSASSPAFLLLQLAVFLVLFRKFIFDLSNARVFLILFVLALGTAAGFLYMPSWDQRMVHLQNNIVGNHFQVAKLKFKDWNPSETQPLFTFFRVGFQIYPPWAMVAYLGLLAAAVFKAFRSRIQGRPLSSSDKIVLTCFLFPILHSLVIDLLPSTKLGRVHFVVYPLMVSGLAAGAAAWLQALNSSARKIAGGILLILFGVHAFSNASLMREMRNRHESAPRYLKTLKGVDLYVLKEDPHAVGLSKWMEDVPLKPIGVDDFNRLLKTGESGPAKALLVGPTGTNSSKLSIMSAVLFQDLEVQIAPPLEPVRLPYYSAFPAFAMEEEVLETMFFRGRLPDFRKESQQLSLYLFKDPAQNREQSVQISLE